MALLRLIFSLLLMSILTACPDDSAAGNIPLDRTFFPTGMAQNGNFLALSSSNFSLRYQQGALLSIDLLKVDAALAAEGRELGESVVSSSIHIPSFSAYPLVVNEKFLVFAARSEAKLLQVPFLGGDLGASTVDIPLDFAPYYIESFVRPADGHTIIFTAGLDSEKIVVIDLDEARIINSHSLSALVKPEKAPIRPSKKTQKVAVRGLKIAASPLPLLNRPPLLFIGCDHFDEEEVRFIDAKSARLLWIPVDDNLMSGAINLAIVKQIDFAKKHIGREIHGFAFSPDQQEIYLLFHSQDSLVRINFNNHPDKSDEVFLGVTGTCHYPIDITVSEDLVYVACFTEAVTAYDRRTLAEKYVNRDFGRGPVKLLFDNRAGISRLYVSYFLDGTIGILDPELTPIGRIFKAIPENMDGGM